MKTLKWLPLFALLLIASVSSATAQARRPHSDPSTTTSAVGASLPSDTTCYNVVHTVPEQRPSNNTPNLYQPPTSSLSTEEPWDGSQGFYSWSDQYRKRVDGRDQGSTDMIIQWAACKWGMDPNLVRAEAVTESNWYMNNVGDFTTTLSNCPPKSTGGVYQNGGCYESYGIYQMKWMYHMGEWPNDLKSTAYNLDFSLGWIRNCYEGGVEYLVGSNGYHSGDIWGCVGFWYSGHWRDSGALSYISTVEGYFKSKPWTQPGF